MNVYQMIIFVPADTLHCRILGYADSQTLIDNTAMVYETMLGYAQEHPQPITVLPLTIDIKERDAGLRPFVVCLVTWEAVHKDAVVAAWGPVVHSEADYDVEMESEAGDEEPVTHVIPLVACSRDTLYLSDFFKRQGWTPGVSDGLTRYTIMIPVTDPGCLSEATHVQYAKVAALFWARRADATGLTVDGLPQAVRRYVPREQRAAGAVAAVARMRVVLRAESVSTFPMTIDLLSVSGGVLGVHDTAHRQRQVEFERLTGFHRCAAGLIVDNGCEPRARQRT